MTCAICGKERPIADNLGPVGWCGECDEAARKIVEEELTDVQSPNSDTRPDA